jgi:hypothetical protein
MRCHSQGEHRRHREVPKAAAQDDRAATGVSLQMRGHIDSHKTHFACRDHREKCAGTRTEPPVSLPRSSPVSPAATAAAAPPGRPLRKSPPVSTSNPTGCLWRRRFRSGFANRPARSVHWSCRTQLRRLPSVARRGGHRVQRCCCEGAGDPTWSKPPTSKASFTVIGTP